MVKWKESGLMPLAVAVNAIDLLTVVVCCREVLCVLRGDGFLIFAFSQQSWRGQKMKNENGNE